MSWQTISTKSGKHLKMPCGEIVMLSLTGLNMHNGKKAKKKFSVQEVFMNVHWMLIIATLPYG